MSLISSEVLVEKLKSRRWVKVVKSRFLCYTINMETWKSKNRHKYLLQYHIIMERNCSYRSKDPMISSNSHMRYAKRKPIGSRQWIVHWYNENK